VSASVRQVRRVLAVGYAAVLLTLGTQPTHPERSSVGFLQTVHLTAGQATLFRELVDLAGNVAVFVPLGLLVMAAWRIPVLGLLSGLLVGGACELVQLFEPGRVASLVDVLTNTLGGLLGAALVLISARRRAARPVPDELVVREPVAAP
jgi:glycopeptide antibiotics resistance protein